MRRLLLLLVTLLFAGYSSELEALVACHDCDAPCQEDQDSSCCPSFCTCSPLPMRARASMELSEPRLQAAHREELCGADEAVPPCPFAGKVFHIPIG